MVIRHLLLAICCLLVTTTFAQVELSQKEQMQLQLQNILLMHGDDHGHDHDMLLQEIDISTSTLKLYLVIPEEHLEDVNEDTHEHLLESLLPALEQYNFEKLQLYVKDGEGSFVQIEKMIDSAPIAIYEEEANNDPFPPIRNSDLVTQNANPHNGQGQSAGSLSGKTVWLSAGHGWKADNSSNNWLTQRGNTHGLVEDFETMEAVNYFLLKYLHNAGANVWTVRERDLNTNEVVVDNDEGAPSYTETGAWSTSGSSGYQGGTYKFATAESSETATAIYTPSIPEEGWYWVSAFFRASDNRPIDARYVVNHAGGSTTVSVNQEVHDRTWVYLGQFYFDAGSTGSVVLTNESSDPGQAIIADAVRFGGGMGDAGDCTYGGSPSGRARVDEAARQYAMFQGYPTCTGDVTIRPKYAEYELSKGTTEEQNNSIYVAWHTNAFNGDARGTVTYAYDGSGTPPITPGSWDLRDFIQEELAGDIIADWDPNWNDRGVNSANFGELRELTTMPGCLVEVAFHDNVDDAAALAHPYFRNLAARAIYKGIVRFFNDRDGSPTTIVPEPPTHLYAKNNGAGQINLNWNVPAIGGVNGDAATGYRVYMSTHGKGFADGIATSTNSYTATGLAPNTTYYFQITSTNAGGESFPTATVAVRTPASGSTDVTYLIVDGFDRIDRSANIDVYESAALGTCERGYLERMNAYNYAVEHAKALSSCGFAFDGASNEAVSAGSIALTDYDGVDWITGEESTVDRTLDATEQSLVSAFLDGGGNLIISGAEIGWDIGRSTSGNAAVSFYNNYLKASYAGDDSGTYNFGGATGGIFDGITGAFDDSSNGYYNSEYPDRMTASSGGAIALNYSGGTGDGAAVAYKGTDFGVVHFGFPLETVTDESVRNNLICNAANYLTPAPPMPTCDIPTNISHTVLSGNVVSFSWDVVLGDVDKYKMRYREVGGSWIEVNAPANLRFLNDLVPNTSYQYQVKTICLTENSAWSATREVTTGSDICDRPVPTGLTYDSATQVTINWTSDPDDVKYKIRYKQAGGAWVEVFVNINSITLTDLLPSTTYKYKLKTKCVAGWVNWSAKYSFTTINSFADGTARMNGEYSSAIFPNPFADNFTVTIPTNFKGKTTFTIVDALGKEVFQTTWNKAQGSTQNISPNIATGIYQFTIQNNDEQFSGKLVKGL